MSPRGLATLLLCAALFGALAAPATAAGLERPDGAVVLTVAGKIARTNRGAFDPAEDLFLKYHDRQFTAAAEFDRDMLEDLGEQEVEITLPGRPAPLRVEGPRLKDLVAAVGGEGSTLTLLALDGYASEITWQELETLNWIVGIEVDDREIGLGQRGPLWVVYTYPDGRALTAEDELRWPWATFYIEIN